MRDFLSIAAIFKDETPYLREWLEYHHLVGVERFYLLDNAADPAPAAAVLRPYVDTGLVHCRHFPGVARQWAGYAELLAGWGEHTEWLAFLDLDEFLYPVETMSVPEILATLSGPQVGGVAVNWAVFGSAGCDTRPPLQIEAYRFRPATGFVGGRTPGFHGNGHVKSIVRPACTQRMVDAHHAAYRPGYHAVNEDGRPVDGGFNLPPSGRRLRVNHYILRSRVEFAEKLARGMVWGNAAGGNESPPERAWLWDDVNSQAVVRDDGMERLLPEVRRRLRLPGVEATFPSAVRRPAMCVAVCCSYFRHGLVQELAPALAAAGAEMHLWALEDPLPGVACWTRGTGRLPKCLALNRLLPHCADADVVLFVDDDVRLPADFLGTFMRALARLDAAIAQPALTPDSYATYAVTLAHAGCWARLTDFVESGPVVAMTRRFVRAATPFPEDNPMGWGVEAYWAQVARTNGWRMAVVDCCPVEHRFRPLGERYPVGEALATMHRYLTTNHLDWPQRQTLRRFPRLRGSCAGYAALRNQSDRTRSQGEIDEPVSDAACVAALAAALQPAQVRAFGPGAAALVEPLERLAASWQGQVTVLAAVPLAPTAAESPADLLLLDAADVGTVDLHRWLNAFVHPGLTSGGVAVLIGIADGSGVCPAARTVRDWLREQPRHWQWEELPGGAGLGLLWRAAPADANWGVLRVPGQPNGEGEKGERAAGTPRADLPLSPGTRAVPRASVIIAAHNEGARLGRTVAACRDACRQEGFELLVVDDASTDGSAASVTQQFPEVRLVCHAERRGGPAAKDLGARAALGDVLVFLDAHCQPEGAALAQLVAAVEERGGRAIITPRVPALDAQRWLASPVHVGHGFRLDLETLAQEWIDLAMLRPAGRFWESPALIGCCMALSRALYDALWGFDAGMRKWGMEDVDLGLKAWLLGYPVLHDPATSIAHAFQTSFDRFSVPEDECLVNHLRLARKHLGDASWRDWLRRFHRRQGAALARRAWDLFQQDRASVERERDYLRARRVRDEFWYARRFGLAWPPPPGAAGADGPDDPRADARARWEDHRARPRNREALPDAQLCSRVTLADGGTLCLHLKLERARSGLVSVRRLTFECAGDDDVVPYASWLSQRLQGETLAHARQLGPEDLLRPFGHSDGPPLPAADQESSTAPQHRAEVVLRALRGALDQV